MEKSLTVKNDVLDVVRSVLVSTLIALAGVLLFALIIRWASLENKVIMPVNIAIKIVSLALGILIGFKFPQNGILKGAISGLLFMLLTFFIFASLNAFKDVKFNWIDFISLPVAGAIVGIVAVNLKRKKR
ncbi:MAG: TIGR04086 family membrane protein [Clostridia bacterium]